MEDGPFPSIKTYKHLSNKTNKLEGELQVATENSQLYQIMDIQKV